MTPLRASELLVEMSRYVDASYPPGTSPEAVDWRRVMKVCEEAGEAVSAYAGYLGENPRKGITHSRNDVVDELLDVAVAALCAIEHLTGHHGAALALLDSKIEHVARRAGLIGEGRP